MSQNNPKKGEGMKKLKLMKKKPLYVCSPEGTVYFRWAGPEGFGMFGFIPSQNRIEIDAEYMGKQFIKDRLCEMVDRGELR